MQLNEIIRVSKRIEIIPSYLSAKLQHTMKSRVIEFYTDYEISRVTPKIQNFIVIKDQHSNKQHFIKDYCYQKLDKHI